MIIYYLKSEEDAHIILKNRLNNKVRLRLKVTQQNNRYFMMKNLFKKIDYVWYERKNGLKVV